MNFSAQTISDIIDGEISGDGTVIIDSPAKIEEATSGNITFLGNAKYEHYLYTTNASAVIVDKKFTPTQEIAPTLIKVENVYGALGVLLNYFDNNEYSADIGISKHAIISKSAEIGNNSSIGHYSTIGDQTLIGEGTKIMDQVYIGKNCKIGSNTMIYPGVKILRNTVIGDHCIIQANVVIGSDGFGFSKAENGQYAKVAQIGNVIIEDNVEIGANTTIDRATMGSTIIRSGVKLDNLIQIAHNAEIGADTVIAAQSGISGSTKIGKRCMIGGQVGFVGHLTIADGTMVQAQSGVASNIKEENQRLYGYPAMNYQGYLRSYAYFRKLPNIIDDMRSMQKELAALKKELNK